MVEPVPAWPQFVLWKQSEVFFFLDLRDYAVPSILQNVRPQMVLSIDNNIYDLRRPFEPPLPTDPNANICQQDPKSSTKDDPDPIAQSSNIDGSSTFKLRSMSDLIATKPLPSAIRLPSLLPQPAINVSPQPTLAASGKTFKPFVTMK